MNQIMISAEEVAKQMGTTHRRVSAMIENGLLPIGCVDITGERRRTFIFRDRWEAYKSGVDIINQQQNSN